MWRSRVLKVLSLSLAMLAGATSCGPQADYIAVYGVQVEDMSRGINMLDVDVLLTLAVKEIGQKIFNEGVEIWFVDKGEVAVEGGAYGAYYYPAERMVIEVWDTMDCLCDTALPHEIVHHATVIQLRSLEYGHNDPGYWAQETGMAARILRRCYAALCQDE